MGNPIPTRTETDEEVVIREYMDIFWELFKTEKGQSFPNNPRPYWEPDECSEDYGESSYSWHFFRTKDDRDYTDKDPPYYIIDYRKDNRGNVTLDLIKMRLEPGYGYRESCIRNSLCSSTFYHRGRPFDER